MRDDIVRRALEAFRTQCQALPARTLRGGDAVDRYQTAPSCDPSIDQPTDEYLQRHAFGGLPYLDAASWRHYLPRLMDYALHLLTDAGTGVIDGLLASLRPPDRVPPRLASLTPEQAAVVREFLEYLSFREEGHPYRELAMQVLEEWWLLNALYRKPG